MFRKSLGFKSPGKEPIENNIKTLSYNNTAVTSPQYNIYHDIGF